MKKILFLVSIFSLALFALASCAVVTDQDIVETVTGQDAAEEVTDQDVMEEAAEEAEYIRISAEEAKSIMESEDVIILDVRTPEEFAQAHIAGALLIPDYELEEKAVSELPDKEAKILIYCRSGRRSELASRLLIGMGYTQVYDFGGIIDWSYETVSVE
jgi:phage shock protein E